jgi:hypothetical protein
MIEKTQISSISGYYGSLWIIKEDKKYYMVTDDISCDLNNKKDWDEINESLYNELLNHENKPKL